MSNGIIKIIALSAAHPAIKGWCCFCKELITFDEFTIKDLPSDHYRLCDSKSCDCESDTRIAIVASEYYPNLQFKKNLGPVCKRCAALAPDKRDRPLEENKIPKVIAREFPELEGEDITYLEVKPYVSF